MISAGLERSNFARFIHDGPEVVGMAGWGNRRSIGKHLEVVDFRSASVMTM
jgi:hypothetical protein